MDKMVAEMLKDLPEETADCMKYLEMANNARAQGLEIEAYYLEMMAYDEYTHARFLLTCLDSFGAEVPDEVRGKYLLAREEVCERMQGVAWTA